MRNFLLLQKLLLCLLVTLPIVHGQRASAQNREERLEIYFRQDIYAIEESVKHNRAVLQRLDSIFSRLSADEFSVINRIEINSWSSPEPGVDYNKKLTERRSSAIRDYILERYDIPDSLLVANACGIAWGRLRDEVAASEMIYRDEVLDILDNTPEETWGRIDPNDRWLSLVDSRVKRLMELRGGRAYKYLYENIFPQLRFGSQVSFVYTQAQPIASSEPVTFAQSELPITTCEQQIAPCEAEQRPLPIALKTNLLYDAVLATNVEVEVPIGDRWSVAGEWVFPWWTWDDGTADSSRSRMQLLNANIEGKYWFGDRTLRPQLTGWYAGLYVGGGLYDFERHAKGYQGEFFIAAGLGGGYAHTINKSGSLRMEYSLGLGYLKTDYRYYEAVYESDNEWHPVRQKLGNYTWIGPTQAKVSLVWLIDLNRKKGGAR